MAYRDNDFDLLDTDDKKFRIPESLRGPTGWGGCSYDDLPDDSWRSRFDNLELNVQMISEVSSPDEIRDLFIRLQSGTALTRQQVRDAWPGNVGPFIEHVAGKLTTQPSSKLFGLIDGRGARSPDDEGDDPYANHRTTAAQLLAVFLAREKSDRSFVGISARDLDSLYHEQASFDPTDDKEQIRLSSNGICARCGKPVLDGEESYHHKVAWARGGRSHPSNGELMHRKCHAIHHEIDPVRDDSPL